MDFKGLSMWGQDVSSEGKLYMAMNPLSVQNAQRWSAVTVAHVLGAARSRRSTKLAQKGTLMQTFQVLDMQTIYNHFLL